MQCCVQMQSSQNVCFGIWQAFHSLRWILCLKRVWRVDRCSSVNTGFSWQRRREGEDTRLPTYHTFRMTRRPSIQTVLTLHCRWRGGKWNFDCYNDRGWEPIASQNCVLLRNRRTSPFRQFNFVWHFLHSEHSVLDFHCLRENVFPTEERSCSLKGPWKLRPVCAHTDRERLRLLDKAELTTGEQKNTSAMMKAAFPMDQTKCVLKRGSEKDTWQPIVPHNNCLQ